MSRRLTLVSSQHVHQVNLVKLSDASGTKLMGLPSMWNRICILDKSGQGKNKLIHLGEKFFTATAQTGCDLFTCCLRLTGTGYTLQLDTAFLFSSDSHAIQTRMGDPSAPFPCVGTLCNERPVSNAPPSALVPLYDGGDFSVQDEKLVDASTNFIMRLRVSLSGGSLKLGASNRWGWKWRLHFPRRLVPPACPPTAQREQRGAGGHLQ